MSDQEDPRDVDADEIRLALPAVASYSRVARLAVTGLASRNGFSYDEVEDLRIAVGELFGALVAPESADDQLSFTCRLSSDRLEVDVVRTPAAPLAEISRLTQQILEAVVDELTIHQPVGPIQIVKCRQDPT